MAPLSERSKALLDLRTEGIREPGYVSGETLVVYDDPSLYIVISTWRSVAHWQAWASSSERNKLAAKVEQLLAAPAKTTVLMFIKEQGN